MQHEQPTNITVAEPMLSLRQDLFVQTNQSFGETCLDTISIALIFTAKFCIFSGVAIKKCGYLPLAGVCLWIFV